MSKLRCQGALQLSAGPFNFKKLFDWMSFFPGSAAKCCEMLRKFLRFALKHNIHKVLIPAKRTTPNTKHLQLNDPAVVRYLQILFDFACKSMYNVYQLLFFGERLYIHIRVLVEDF